MRARRRLAVAVAVLLVILSPASAVSGEPSREVDARPSVDPSAAPVDLDSLLKLPDGFSSEVATRQGATAVQWRGRYERVREELETARENLARVEKELDSAAGSSSAWQISAPGATNPEASPLSFRLRKEVKEQRAEIAEAERRLRALDVEADLASVPPAWRQ